MLLVTSNERDLPDLTPAQLDEDLEAIRRWAYDLDRMTGAEAGRVHAFQEVNEAADHAQLRAKFPADKWHNLGNRQDDTDPLHENALALERDRFTIGGRGYLYLGPGRAKISPHREGTYAEDIGIVARPDVPPFDVIGVHTVSGAWTHPGQAGDADGWRIAAWNEEWSTLAAHVAKRNAAGRTAIVLGDLNRITGIPKLTPAAFPIASNRYDHIIVCPAEGGAVVTPLGTELLLSAGLHTDHPTLARRVRLDPPAPIVITPPPVVEPAPKSVAATLTAGGLVNVTAIVDAAKAAGLPLNVAAALTLKESGGRNVWGHDKGGVFSGLPGEVTEDLFRAFLHEITVNGRTSNGVGPAQITYPGHFPVMAARGLKAWVPVENLTYGYGLLKGYLDAGFSLANAGARYNGGNTPPPSAVAYGRDLATRAAAFARSLA